MQSPKAKTKRGPAHALKTSTPGEQALDRARGKMAIFFSPLLPRQAEVGRLRKELNSAVFRNNKDQIGINSSKRGAG